MIFYTASTTLFDDCWSLFSDNPCSPLPAMDHATEADNSRYHCDPGYHVVPHRKLTNTVTCTLFVTTYPEHHTGIWQPFPGELCIYGKLQL